MSEPTLAGIVRHHAGGRPDRTYLHFEGTTSSYADLDQRTNRVAAALVAAGVRPGDRIALLDRNGPVCFEVMFGGAKCGAVYVPVSWRLAPPEVAAIVDDAQPVVLMVGADFLPSAQAALQRRPETAVVVVGGAPGPYPAYEEWLAAPGATDPAVVSRPEDVAVLMYTSGTTGTPKGVMLTNAGLLGRMHDSGAIWHYDATSVQLVVMPLFHIGGTSIGLESIVPGATTVLLREFDPARVLEAISAYDVTNVLLVPAMIQMLVDTPGCDALDWSSLRTLIYGGSPISDTLLRRAMEIMKCDFVQIYGMTEHSGCISCLPTEDHDPEGRPGLLRSCGRPLPWVEVQIADPETGAPRAAGEVGEIRARSDQTMLGYWGKPDDTAEALTAEGWLRTGDAGYLDDQGYLYIQDRVKDMIISGGENVYPSEIESVLLRHEGIADAAVIGVPHERWGETPMAIVVLQPGATVSADDVIAFCRTQLAGFKCPTSVDLLDALPRNASGKVQKTQLQEPYWRGRARRVN